MQEAADLAHQTGDSTARTELADAELKPGTASLLLKRLGTLETPEVLSKGTSSVARAIKDRTQPGQLTKDYRNLLHLTQELGYDRAIEKLLFVPSRGNAPLSEFAIDSPNKRFGHNYHPVHRLSLEWALSQLPQKLNEYTFVDYGAGKGRALLLASLYDFRHVTGVEFAAELHDDATMNIAQFPRSLMKCRDVDCVHMDAVDFPVPAGKGVYFFHDPFSKEVLETVLARITASYRAQPRRIYLVFVKPLPQDMLDLLIENAVIFEPLAHTKSEKVRLQLLSPDPVAIYKSLI